jgi:hypothetical protein
MDRTLSRVILIGATATLLSWTVPTAWADEAKDRAELAKALTNVKPTLQDGLSAAQADGTPISAKFEVEDGKLQLSVYTMKGPGYSEVVIDPATGKVAKSETITDKDDLTHAGGQKAAMAKAKLSLSSAVSNALKANAGYRAVSVFPQLKAGHPVAAVTLLRGTAYKTTSEKLD